MSTAFETRAPNYRLAKTQFGDDLQAVALRELGDPNRWVELVWLNQIASPYITDDPRRASATVLLSGALIKVPAPVGVWRETEETGQVFERDCAMVRRQLQATEGGDLSVVAGVDNFQQQLLHRVVTPKGQARRHPDYGCNVWKLQGRVNGATAAALGAQYVRSALASDYRVSEVGLAKAEVRNDSLTISATAVGIDGGVVDLSVGS